MATHIGSINVPGLEAIYHACRKVYSDQPNPLQVTAVKKYWLGGPDPLDYISMYSNPGDPALEVYPHWHYVSFGLTDLHGDERVHEFVGGEGASGYGFELTFRLKREAGENSPPTWPAALLQALARYVFQTDNEFVSGDHVPWHSSLDGSESRIQHILMTDDPQLEPVSSPNGQVKFVQIVGVTAEELKAAQKWNGPGVLDVLKEVASAGGPWLVTDMRRGETVFEIDPNLQEQVEQGIMSEGSNLSGVTSRCAWSVPDGEEDERQISPIESAQIKAALKKGLVKSGLDADPIHERCVNFAGDGDVEEEPRKHSVDSDVAAELMRTKHLSGVHLKFDLEAAMLLPLALKGRLAHGRHFTFKSALNDTAITLVTNSVTGSFASEAHPYAAHGPWLHILVSEDLCLTLQDDLMVLEQPSDLYLPHTFSWPERLLYITVQPNELPEGASELSPTS